MNSVRDQTGISPQNRLHDVVPASAVTLTAFAVRIWAIDAKGLSYDESATALMSRASIPEIVLFHWDAAFEHLPLWVMIMHLWSRLAGQSELTLRLIPALAGVLTVPLVWSLLRKARPNALSWRILTALLIALSPTLVYYSQEARMYTLVVLLAVSSVFLLLRYLDRPQCAPLLAFIVINWAMLGVQYYSALLLAAEGAFIVAVSVIGISTSTPSGAFVTRHRVWLALGALALSALPALLWMAYAPGFRETLEVVLRESSKHHRSVAVFGADLWTDLTFGAIRWQPAIAIIGFLMIPVFLFGALSAFWLRDSNTSAAPLPYSLWPLLFALIVTIPLAISGIMFRTLAARYILYVLPFILAFTAFGVVQLWRASRLSGAAAGTVVLAIAMTGLLHYFGPYTKSEYREMVRYLEQRYRPEQDSVMIEAPRQHLLAKYYLGQDFPLQPVPDVSMPDYWPLTAPPVVPDEVDDLVKAHLQGSANIWLILSAEAEVDPGEFLSKYLTAVAYKDECKSWLDVRLCRFVSPQTVDYPLVSDLNAEFAEELVLERTHLSLLQDPDASAEAPLRIRTDWWAKDKPSADYKYSVKLIGEGGVILEQADQYPIGTLLPPTTWTAGDRKPGYIVVNLPPGLPRGHYSIRLDVYDPQNLEPVAYRIGRATNSRKPLNLGVLEIDDTMRLLPAGANSNR
jgi:mannosyltransferase